MSDFGKKPLFLNGPLDDLFDRLSSADKQRFNQVADEIFRHFHQAAEVMGIKYLLGQLLVKKKLGALELVSSQLLFAMTHSNYSVAFKIVDLETIKSFIEKDSDFASAGRGSGSRYQSGLSHAANEAALWYLLERNDLS